VCASVFLVHLFVMKLSNLSLGFRFQENKSTYAFKGNALEFNSVDDA